jgi:hypothetical protein
MCAKGRVTLKGESMQQTSAQAYKDLQSSGALGKLQLLVVECLKSNGPLTQAECSRIIGNNGENQGITPRFAELKLKGVIAEVGKKQCSVSGRTVLAWDLKENISSNFKRPLTLKERLEIAEEFIESKGLTEEYKKGVSI